MSCDGRLQVRLAPSRPSTAFGAVDSKVSIASSASIAAGSDLVSEKPSPVASAACSRTLMRSTRRSKCSRSRGLPRAPSGDSSRVSSARSNSALARRRWPSASSLLAGFEMLIRRRDQDRDRIRRRLWSGNWRRDRRRRLRDDLHRLAPGPDTHPAISRAPITGTTGRCLLLGIQSCG